MKKINLLTSLNILSYYRSFIQYKYLQKTLNISFYYIVALSIDGDSLAGPDFSNSAGSTSRFFPNGGGPINFSTSSYVNVSFSSRASAS